MLGKRLGPQAIWDTAQQFGLGQTTQNTFSGENAGNIPNSEWKRKTGRGGWSTGDTLNMSIGQGFITCTPLQMAVMIEGVANRGAIWRPYMVDKIVDQSGNTMKSTSPSLLPTVT